MITDTVGLDIGHTAIKAVRFRRNLRGRESVTFFQQKFPAPTAQPLDESQRAQVLKHFVHTHRLTGARLTTALPCGDLFMRTLALPFQDIKKLSQVVPGEVESMIPLPLEDVAVDFQRLTAQRSTATDKEGPSSHVMVAVAHKATLSSHVRRLAEAGIDLGAIQVDALALLSLVKYLGQRHPDLPENLAIIDIGASKTTICLSHRHDPWLVRTVRWGTDHLSNGSSDYEPCSLPETELSSEAAGPATSHRKPAFTALVRELRRTLHAYESTTHTRLRHGWFCGGGAELQELPAELAGSLELEAISLPQRYKARYTPEYSVAFGLAVSGHAPGLRAPLGAVPLGAGIDLKRVMDATLVQLQERWRQLWHIGLAALVIVLLFFADLSVQMVLKEDRLQELKSALRSQFQLQFPGIAVVINELDQAKSALLTIRRTTDLLGADEPQMVPVFAELVQRLPKGVALKVHALTIERSTIQLEAETDSFESVEKIKAGLLAFTGATDVGVREARIGATSNQVLFRVTVNRKAP
ncbi:MAG TPA: pilus assembly protein PilM [Nitrospiraceae bacterium]|nr:pilus assembly protein PilM [Nitrospiraceae bacterium]